MSAFSSITSSQVTTHQVQLTIISIELRQVLTTRRIGSDEWTSIATSPALILPLIEPKSQSDPSSQPTTPSSPHTPYSIHLLNHPIGPAHNQGKIHWPDPQLTNQSHPARKSFYATRRREGSMAGLKLTCLLPSRQERIEVNSNTPT